MIFQYTDCSLSFPCGEGKITLAEIECDSIAQADAIMVEENGWKNIIKTPIPISCVMTNKFSFIPLKDSEEQEESKLGQFKNI